MYSNFVEKSNVITTGQTDD